MNEQLYIMSTCLSKTRKYSKFKLKGSYKGTHVKFVYIPDLSFEIGKEYIAQIFDITLKKDSLFAECNVFKEIIHLR